MESTARMGDLAELFGLTPRAIRHYESRGLISPARDRLNRRVFDAVSRRRLQLIAVLRRAGVPLQDVREVLTGAEGAWTEASAKALQSLSVRRAQLEHQLREIRQVETLMRLEITQPGRVGS
jgi:DNA-binding transcriptional MerR regulator